MADNKLDQWALVELMGHQRIIGRVTEHEVAGAKLLRVDVPSVNGQQPVTKLFGASAIYCITFLEEDTARIEAEKIDTAPIAVWDARLLAKRLPPLSGNLYGGQEADDEEDL